MKYEWSRYVLWQEDPIGLMGNKGARKHLFKVKFSLFPHKQTWAQGKDKVLFLLNCY